MAESPVTVINELLQQSNIPITITIQANERVMASRNAGPQYSAAQLSDGERNALLIAGSVLTAPAGMLLIIDEPERHLHRSIIAPLLGQLFARRPDCSFVISTHDHNLPLTHPTAGTLLLRSCTFNGPKVQSWDADELPAGSPIDDNLRRDLLGARRSILFVEGTERSLDKSLYSIVFPMVSVIPKGSCHEVEEAVVGARSSEALHWLRAVGIVDSDGLEGADIAAKRGHEIYAVPFYSVEALYFHPQVIRWVASRVVSIHGGDAGQLAQHAIAAGVAAIRGHTERLSRKAAKKVIRRSVIEQIPGDDNLLRVRGPIVIVNEPEEVHARYMRQLESAVEQGDWETKRAETLRKPGRYQAGDTVYLVVAKGRTGRVNKRWVQRLHVQGKRRDISIGTYPAVTLSEAREQAHDNRLTAKRGGDPSGRASTVPTFADVSAKVDQGGQWCGRTRETRRRTLARYAARLMGRPVDQIDRAAVLSVLGPVYRDKPATGKLLRGWVRGVLAAAQALGHVDVKPYARPAALVVVS